MSVQSAKRLQEPIFAISHKNNLNSSMEPHSVRLDKVSSAPHQQWVAAFIDGQYFLTDPQSMQRLKHIQAQIQEQRKKLAKLENDNQSQSHSFYSLRQDKGGKFSNKSFCGTEFDQNIQLSKKQVAKVQLQREEDRYKEKIKNMQKEKMRMKKDIKLSQQHHETQVKLSSQKHAQGGKGQNKESTKKQAGQAQRSKKTPKRSIKEENKQKSYHKSRIQQSIKDNLQIIQSNLQIKPKQHKQASMHFVGEKSMKSHRHTAKESAKANQTDDLEKQKNALQSVHNVENKSFKHQSASKKVHEPYEEKVQSEISNSIKVSQRSQQKQIQKKSEGIKGVQKNQQQKVLNNEILNKTPQKQSRVVSNKQVSQSIPQFNETAQKKIQRSKYEVKVIDVNSIDSSQVKNKAQNSDIKSLRSVHSNLIYQNINDDKKSKNSSAIKNDNEEIKTKKSHINNVEYTSNVSHQVVLESKPHKNIHFEQQQMKSKKPSLNDQVKSRKSDHQPFYNNNIFFPATKGQDLKSQKSQGVNKVAKNIAEDVKSKKSYYENYENKSQIHEQHDKSNVRPSNTLLLTNQDQLKLNKKQEQDLKSRKSSKIEQRQISIRKSSRAKSIRNVEKSQIQSKKSSYIEDAKSKKSQIDNHKQQNKIAQSFNKSITAKAEEKNQQTNKKSISSRVSVQKVLVTTNEIKFQNSSVKDSSQIQLKESSINQSSNIKIQIENNRLAEEHVQNIGEPTFQNLKMIKRKNQSYENQSEKKSKSFIIHSRNGSVKERSQKQFIVAKNNRVQTSKKQVQVSSNNEQSVTKEQITKLYEQITFLKQKLKVIEDKQEQMEKMEKTFSKINSHQLYEPVQAKEIEELQNPTLNQQIETLNKIVTVAKPHPKLEIQSSIVQVNTQEEIIKKIEMEAQADQKNKLNHQISRLKKIIRDMQIEKIKSIDYEHDLGQSQLIKNDSKKIDPKDSRTEKESVNSIQGVPAKKNFWGKPRLEQAGKIIKNTQAEQASFIDVSPKRLSHNRLKYMPKDQQVIQPEELPFHSNNKRKISNLVQEAHKHSLIEKIHDKERDFHHFVESSRIFAEQPKYEQTEVQNEFSGLKKFSKIEAGNNETSNKINYSRLVEEFRKNNPEEQEVLPEIHLRDIKIPLLPPNPTAEMSQEQLLALAKEVYQIFSINIDQQDRQLCVKKYKNCVVFTVSNSYDCILWHFSGKFYMGGWKMGEPGEGEKNGEGLQIVPQKHAYKGQFLNGKKNGTGIIKIINGNIYDGQWIDGTKNGRGVYFDSATKVIYSGEWKDGKKDGQGFLKLSQKEYYYGTFIKSVKQGFGSEVFINGDKYKGEYKNGKFHGKGKYVWANGSCYQGQFVEGARHGQGSWKSAKNNGDIYIGTYQNDKKNGYGRYVWANGCMYQGGFANDVKHGKGRLTYQDGKQIKGIWQQGNLVNTENEKKQVNDQDQPLRRSVKANTFGYHPATSRRF